MLTTSRHSLNDSASHGPSMNSAKSPIEPVWKKENDSSSLFSSGIGSVTHMDSVRSSPPDQEVKTDASSTSTFDRGSTHSPVSGNLSGNKTSPTESMSNSSQSSREKTTHALASINGGQRNSRQRYDGIYYTHEPIRGAPVIDFKDDDISVEINHRNTEV
jgi:hypothetical protein